MIQSLSDIQVPALVPAGMRQGTQKARSILQEHGAHEWTVGNVLEPNEKISWVNCSILMDDVKLSGYIPPILVIGRPRSRAAAATLFSPLLRALWRRTPLSVQASIANEENE